jgi:hypothetical protein
MAYKTLLIYLDPDKNKFEWRAPYGKQYNYLAIALDVIEHEELEEFYPHEYQEFLKWRKAKKSQSAIKLYLEQ